MQVTDPVFDQIVKATRGSRKRRFQRVWEYCSKKMVCEADDPKEEDEMGFEEQAKPGHGGCGRVQPNIRREGLKLFTQWKKGKGEDEEGEETSGIAQAEKRPLPASEAHTILKKMSSEDIAVLGLSEENARPDWMILTVMPVPPPPVRPSVQDGGEDDLTYKLADVIRANATLKKMEQEGTPAHILADFEQLLQFHCATFMDNDIAVVT